MSKNIIIGILSALLLLSVVLIVYEQTEVEKFRIMAVANERIAKDMSIKAHEQMKRAEEQRQIADANAMEAMKQREIAMTLLKKKESN